MDIAGNRFDAVIRETDVEPLKSLSTLGNGFEVVERFKPSTLRIAGIGDEILNTWN